MLRFIERKRNQSVRCDHPETRTTTNFGIERIVCMACGHVDVRNLAHETVVRAEFRPASAAR